MQYPWIPVLKMARFQKLLEFLRWWLPARVSVISGGTGSGKTTLINAIGSFIPYDESIVTIEDTAELQTHPDVSDEWKPDRQHRRKGQITLRIWWETRCG